MNQETNQKADIVLDNPDLAPPVFPVLLRTNQPGKHQITKNTRVPLNEMARCSSAMAQAPTSIAKFIQDQPYLSMLETKCTNMRDLKKIHSQLIKTGLAHDHIAASRLLAFSASPAGEINYAYLLFRQLQNPNLFAWNTIIRGSSQSTNPLVALTLFVQMLVSSPVQPQRLTYPSLFKACAQLGAAPEGAQLHGMVVKLGLESDRYIRNTMLYMYATCALLVEAWRVFNKDMEFDVIAWNSMIIGLAKCCEVHEARRLFDEMPERNTVTWNSMISGYVRNGKLVEALELFQEMQKKRIKPSEFTMVSLLNACGCLGAIRQGKWIHNYLKIHNFPLNPIVVTAIIDMYCKCGSAEQALLVFRTAPKKALPCWNSMILGLASNGYEEAAIELFSELESSSGLKPDFVTFIGVLAACNHSGMVDKAIHHFSLMTRKYNIKPSIKHYTCMVDVLGGAGHLEEAEELIRSMPINHDGVIWGSLLSACRRHGSVEIAERAAKHVIELNVNESAGYVLMSNVYSSAGRFEDSIEQRLSMMIEKVEKEPGCSSIEVDGEVQEFVSAGSLHHRAQEIYLLLSNELPFM